MESNKCPDQNPAEMSSKRLKADASSSKDTQQYDKILLEPFYYIFNVPGKEVRGKLGQAFNFWMKIPNEKLEKIAEITRWLHNASLLIDDIEDDSVLRRGKPVAHSIFGVGSTINSANYVYFLGLQKVLALDHPKAVEVFCEQMLVLHRGQGLDIHWRDTFQCPSEEQYRAMTVMKTGGLFGLAIRLMQLFSSEAGCHSNGNQYCRLTDTLGLYFQIRDDYANLCMKDYSDKKTYCEDLTEGKFSFPIIHAIKTRPHDHQIINILRRRPAEVEVKKHCVSLLEEFGSLQYTRDTLRQLDADAREALNLLGGNAILTKLLDSLNNWDQ